MNHHKIPLYPPFSKGEGNISSLWDHFPAVRQKKGGREGFLKRYSITILS
jgi:hypothetical protein